MPDHSHDIRTSDAQQMHHKLSPVEGGSLVRAVGTVRGRKYVRPSLQNIQQGSRILKYYRPCIVETGIKCYLSIHVIEAVNTGSVNTGFSYQWEWERIKTYIAHLPAGCRSRLTDPQLSGGKRSLGNRNRFK